MGPEKKHHKAKNKTARHHIQRYTLTGILTLIPFWITWLFFRVVFETLSDIGLPWVRKLSLTIKPTFPSGAQWILSPVFQSSLAVLLTLFALYILGWATSRVIGKRVWRMIDAIIERIPFAHKIYGSTKKLLSILQKEPGEQVQRVVLIDFPSDSMKTVGFVTTVLEDSDTGEKLAAVYVPTTPNPTSGYLEIVPLDRLVSTNWTMEEAMTFIISGGAVAPDKLSYRNSKTAVS